MQSEKRTHQRIRTNLYARFYYDKNVHNGIVMNLSLGGMCIKTSTYLPVDMKFDILIPLINEVLKIPAEVNRLIMIEDLYDGVGVQLMEQSQNFLDFMKGMTHQ